MQPVFLNDWKDETAETVFREFDGTRWSHYRAEDAVPVQDKPEYKGVEILFASYGYENYSGDAFVLFRRDGKLYEVNGGHCSCYGLEGQWEPEETTIEALRHRLSNGWFGTDKYSGNVFADVLQIYLDNMKG